MNPQMEGTSVGTKEWLETTQGWVIYAYVGNDQPIEPLEFSDSNSIRLPTG